MLLLFWENSSVVPGPSVEFSRIEASNQEGVFVHHSLDAAVSARVLTFRYKRIFIIIPHGPRSACEIRQLNKAAKQQHVKFRALGNISQCRGFDLVE